MTGFPGLHNQARQIQPWLVGFPRAVCLVHLGDEQESKGLGTGHRKSYALR